MFLTDSQEVHVIFTCIIMKVTSMFCLNCNRKCANLKLSSGISATSFFTCLKTIVEIKGTVGNDQYISIWKMLSHRKAAARS